MLREKLKIVLIGAHWDAGWCSLIVFLSESERKIVEAHLARLRDEDEIANFHFGQVEEAPEGVSATLGRVAEALGGSCTTVPEWLTTAINNTSGE